MRVAPTLDGRIRIDLETELDLLVLRAIRDDAEASDADGRLREAMGDGAGADWEEFVMPELKSVFERQLDAIELELRDAKPGSGQAVFIAREDAEAWYGGLNQARLALEARHRLSEVEPDGIEGARRSAWFRSQFYLQLQSLLLEFLMRG